MAPLRRYIRITPHTTLQAQIFLEDPSLLHTWLIHPTTPALPRIIDSLKDVILPKLREEREREQSGPSKKHRAVKDVVVGNDFEVSVFFQDGATRHALVMPKREFLGPKSEGRLKSNSSKMVLDNDSLYAGGDLDGGGQGASRITNLRIEDEDEEVDLHTLPLAPPPGETENAGDVEVIQQTDVRSVPAGRSRRRTRTHGKRGEEQANVINQPSEDEEVIEIEATEPSKRGTRRRNDATRKNTGRRSEEEEPIVVDSASDSESRTGSGAGTHRPAEEKKKPLFRTSYEAHTIYGKTLYLLIKRRDVSQTAAQSEDMPNTVVTRDIPFGSELDEGEPMEDVMESWMIMSQVIRDDPDL